MKIYNCVAAFRLHRMTKNEQATLGDNLVHRSNLKALTSKKFNISIDEQN